MAEDQLHDDGKDKANFEGACLAGAAIFLGMKRAIRSLRSGSERAYDAMRIDAREHGFRGNTLRAISRCGERVEVDPLSARLARRHSRRSKRQR